MSDQIKDLENYEFIKEEQLEELQSLGLILRHKKSGARVIVLSNEDENKVFSIGFRTTPADSTGVPHIIEHTVLCGSKEFPAKDPFIELTKGSLNTFLNAMTYPDKTIYPLASCNQKDFNNLMHVYLDAVFYPNIYQKEEIFKQEGWHYELDSEDGELQYNGVVYNEMKGAFSSPEQQLYRLIQQSLLPDTTYACESGGDPDVIPELTYEQFLDFHRKYYHASNSYIYLYGDMDVEERLNFLDEHYLSKFENVTVDSEITRQEPFEHTREVVEEYSIAEGEDEKGKTYLSYNMVIGTSLDKELYLAFQVLDYVLLSAPGAPLKQALLDKGIGKDVFSSYDNGIYQPIFSIITKNADLEQKEEFVKVIKNALEEIVENGLDEKSLRAGINYYEFKYREADFGQFPKGLMYGIQILDSWLYDDTKPFIHICANKTFEFLKQSVGTGYYENLIKTYLIENTHSSLVIVKPKIGLTMQKEYELKQKLAEYKASLSKEEIAQLIEDTKKLHEYEETPSTKEELEKIPLLSIDDIGKGIHPLYNKEKEVNGVKVLHHNVYTNGIGYLKLSFDISDLGKAAPYLGLLSTVLGYVDTEHYSFLELANEINVHTGGIGAIINIYNQRGEKGVYSARFELKAKALFDKIPKMFELIHEILENTKLDDEKRLKEILEETKSRMEMKLNSRGHSTAVNRAMSYFSESDLFDDNSSGIGYYQTISDWTQNFEEKKDTIIKELSYWLSCIFRTDNLIVSFTADEKGYSFIEPELSKFIASLTGTKNAKVLEKEELVCKNEGFKTPGQVQYVARCGNYMENGAAYTGSLKVLKTILSYDYLWNMIRVKGGAYGCMCGFSYDGKGYFTSYRDPKLKETDEVYAGVYDFVKNFEIDDRDMTKYIIGTISGLDTPLTPAMKGSRSFGAYMCDVDEAFLQKERDEVLATTKEKIRATADVVKAIYDASNICVIGSENQIEDNRELFKEVTNLLR